MKTSHNCRIRQRTWVMRITWFMILCNMSIPPICNAQGFRSAASPNSSEGTVKLQVVDRATALPIADAPVYLVPEGDTIITNLTVSDSTGSVRLLRVPQGCYTVFIEAREYHPVVFNQMVLNPLEDLGVVLLDRIVDTLDEARITSYVSAVEKKRDTLVLNVSSFFVGNNEMLEDLLAKMPALRISESGVTFNGKEIKQITIDGRNFFLNDPLVAVKTIPAKSIEKVLVIDQKRAVESMTGIVEDREKVVDIVLRKEYKTGFWGYIRSALGGSVPYNKKDTLLVERKKTLFSGTGIASLYGEKDQATLAATAWNAPLGKTGDIVQGDGKGLRSLYKGGLNVNSQRIGGTDLTGTVVLSQDETNKRMFAERTYLTMPAKTSSMTQRLFNRTKALSLSGKASCMQTSKYSFSFLPELQLSIDEGKEAGNTFFGQTESEFSPDTRSFSSETKEKAHYSVNLSFGVKDIKKRNRSFNVDIRWGLNVQKGTREERYLSGTSVSGPNDQDLLYRTSTQSENGTMRLSYVEPITSRWLLKAEMNPSFYRWNISRQILHVDLLQDGNSSVMKLQDYLLDGNALMQYSDGETSIQFGVSFSDVKEARKKGLPGMELYDVLNSNSLYWSPRFSLKKETDEGTIDVVWSGSPKRPSPSFMRVDPVFSVPTEISLGNVFLKPEYRHSINMEIDYFFPEKNMNLLCEMEGGLVVNPTVRAIWDSGGGRMCSVPVNARRPTVSVMMNLLNGFALFNSKRWRAEAAISGNYSKNPSFCQIAHVPSVDVNHFRYDSFMSSFWGEDEHGSIFYSGKSGLAECHSQAYLGHTSLVVSYQSKSLFATIGGSFLCRGVEFSQDATLNRRVKENYCKIEADWTPVSNVELQAKVYGGRIRGLGVDNDCLYGSVDLNLSFHIRSLSFAFQVTDLLNNLRRPVYALNSNYSETAYYNRLGRHFFIAVKWDFGKMNAEKTRRANSVLLD